MAFLGSLNISGSALTAERFRMDIISQNIVHAETTMTADGNPYRRKLVVFQERPLDFHAQLQEAAANQERTSKSGKQRSSKQSAGAGTDGGIRITQVVDSKEEFVPVYDPTHPHANAEGYVMYPNVNILEEQADFMAATRAYEANLAALQVGQGMAMKALDLLK